MCSVRGFLGSCYGSFFLIALMLMLFSLSSLAADTGWLTMPDNDHAQVRATADKSSTGDVKILLEVQLAPGWKHIGALPEKVA